MTAQAKLLPGFTGDVSLRLGASVGPAPTWGLEAGGQTEPSRELVAAHSAGGPWHTDTRCYGVAMFCQDCSWDVCGNWYLCGICVGFSF